MWQCGATLSETYSLALQSGIIVLLSQDKSNQARYQSINQSINQSKMFTLRESRRGAWRLRGSEAWRLGGLERLRGLECRNHNQGLPETMLRASKMEPRGLQNGTRGFKMLPSWFKIGQTCNLEALTHPKRAKQTSGKRPGSAPGSQNRRQGAPEHPKSLSKWCRHGVKIEFKTGPTRIHIPSAKKYRFSRICGSIFY